VTAETIANLINGYSFNFCSEKDWQDAIDAVFTVNRIPFEREVEISGKERIDFMVGDIGLEIKIGFAYAAVIRQLSRYALNERIGELILLTSRSQHQMPATMHGKKLTTINFGFGSL